MIDLNFDTNIWSQASTLAIRVSSEGLKAGRFECFSSWTKMKRAMAVLIRAAGNFRYAFHIASAGTDPSSSRPEQSSVHQFARARKVIVDSVQREVHSKKLKCIE